MKHADLLAMLMPSSYDQTDPLLTAGLYADGSALDSAKASADAVLAAVTPYGAGSMIGDWERVLAIVPPATATYQQRVDTAVAKIAQTGGLSIPYFTQLAARLGYTVTIDEFAPPQVGIAKIGCKLWAEDMRWVWRVNINGSGMVGYKARAGTAKAGDPILSFQDPVIEQVFNDLKPAFT